MTDYSIFSAADIQALLGSFWSVIGDNLPVILVLTGTMIGVAFALKRANTALKGRL